MKKLNLLLLIVFVSLSSTQSLLFLGRDAPSHAPAHQTPQTPSSLSNPQALATSGVPTWTNITTSIGPRPFRSNAQMVYDAADGYSVLIDGTGATWKSSAGSWVQISASSIHPGYRTYARMVYDAADGYVVYFGGLYIGWMNDTWKFHAGTWTNITSTAGLAPSGRNQYALGYDDADHYVLLFGGGCSSAFRGCLISGGSFKEFTDTWKFQSGTWTNITSTVGTAPSADNFAASIVYDPSDGYTILVGQGGTWKFSGGTWSKLAISGPIIGSDAGLVYDDKQGYVVVFGGCCSYSQTWKFSSGAWANITTMVGTPPSPRLEFGMAYDNASGSVILFGGEFYDATHLTPAFYSDTWKLSVTISTITPFNCEWDASSRRFPDQACPPWQAINTDPLYVPVLSNGNLTLHGSSAGHYMFYKQAGANISFPAIGEIQARLKVDSDTSSVNYRAAAWITFVVAPYTGNTLFIGQDKVFLLTGPQSVGQSVTVDTHLSFHTYTITVNSTGTIQVYQDDIPILTGSTYYNTSPTDNGPVPLIEWGEGGGAAFGVSEWQFVRHNAHATGCASQCTPAPLGLIHWWRAEGNANDSVGGDSGTLVNGAGFASGKVGQAFSFNGVNQYVQTTNPVSFSSNDFSVDSWTNLNSNPSITGFIADDNGIGCTDKWVLWLEFGILNLHLNKAGSCVGTGGRFAQYPWTPNLHQWYNIAVTRKAGNITIYIDGVKVSSELTTFTSNPTAPLTIGQADTRFLDGSMDEVQIYDRALNSSEIQAIHDAGSAGVCTCVPAPTGLVSWWPGDGNTRDIIGNHDGVLENGASFGQGEVGQAFSFNGINQFVNVTNDPAWNFGSNPFSIDLWVKFNQAPGGDSFISHDEGQGNQNKWFFGLSPEGGGVLAFHINGPTIGAIITVSVPWSPTPMQWYHVAVTRNMAQYRLYIDGVNVANGTDSTSIPNAAAPLTIGTAEGSFFHNGLIDEVQIFDRPLNASEIQSIFNAGSLGQCKPTPTATWTQVFPSVSPSPRKGAGMTFDSADGYVVLFGGWNSTSVFGDTWEYKAGTWTQIFPTTSPSPRFYIHNSMVYDAADGYVLLFGGDTASGSVVGDTWEFKAGIWTQIVTATSPSARDFASMAYDAADQYVLLFGGYGSSGDTWEFKAGVWTQLSPSVSPPTRAESSMVYDAADGYVVLFGGWEGGSGGFALGDTWEFKAGIWTQLTPATSPSPRFDPSIVYDAADGYVVLFGGGCHDDTSCIATCGIGCIFNETWKFQGGLWTRLNPTLSPPGRADASISNDAADGYVFLFDGANNTAIQADNWRYGPVTPVSKVTPAISSTLTPSTITIGTSASDLATVSGGSSPTGSVTYTAYSDSACTSLVFTSANLALGAPSGTFTPSTAGTYYWIASYSGDANNNAVATSCGATGETLTVAKATPTIVTTIFGGCFPTGLCITPVSSIQVGESVRDQATLTGGFPTTGITGTVTYTLFRNADCSGLGTAEGTVTIGSGNAVDRSGFVTPTSVGSYSMNAAYNGDPDNNPVTSGCEALTVTQATPTISTTLTPSKITIGGSASDNATLVSGFHPTGTMTYTAYTDPFCISTAAFTDTEPLGTPSKAFTPTAAGAYYWKAIYSGDGNNTSIGSPVCGPGAAGEVLTVGKASPSISTTLSPATITLGASTSDLATVSGGFRVLGSVTYTAYSDASCTTQVFTDTEPLGTASKSFTPTAAGSYYWNATYHGDVNNNAASTICGASGETLTVATKPDFALTPTSTTVTAAANSVASDKLRVDAINGFSGTVSFLRVGSMSGLSYSCSSVTLSLTVVSANSTCTFSSNTPGMYTAVVNGTGGTPLVFHLVTYTVTVVKNSPSIHTALSASTITVGESVTDSATLTGTDLLTASGTVTYQFFSGSSCAGAATIVGTPVVVNGGVIPASASKAFNSAGLYSWNATYSGDASNNGATSRCEPLTVNKASPTLLTLLSSNSITVGNSVSDSATLAGGFQAGGTVTYSVFTDNICTAPGKIVSTVAVTAGVVPDSRQVTFNSTGDFGFQASYSGDGNNNVVTSSCEPLTVSTNVSIRTALSATTIIVGGSVTDAATLAGQSATASGRVTYSDFSDGTCAGPITTVSIANVVNGVIPDSRAVTFNSTGSFSFEAVYSGDTNDNSATSSCESLTIEKAMPHVTSTVTPSAITVGSSATDLAVVSGFIPTGTITYTAYSDSSCTTSVFTSTSIPLGASSGAFTPTAAGTYYWIASYSGDSNNNAAATTCGAPGETLTVNGVPFDYSLSVSPVSASIIAGSSTSTTVTATFVTGTAQPVMLLLVISPNPAVCQVSSGPSPCGTISFSPTSITPSSNGATSTLAISTTGIVPPGRYVLTITGSPAGSSHSSATFTLTITAPSVSTVSCGHDQSCSVLSNSTLTNVKFAGITIHAEADGPKGTHGYANITIPKTAIHNIDNLHVFVDNSKLARSDVTITSNSTDYFIYFTFTFHSPVQIDIQLTDPQPTPSAPTIMGLNPTLFYVILGFVIAVIAIGSAALAIRRQGKSGVTG